MPFNHMTDQQNLIIDDIRTEICLADPKRKIIYRESEIAERYGISRTPVRQVLQYLAHCLMVETQRGYGTVVRSLQEEERDTELNAYVAIAKACALTLENVPISKATIVELVGLDTWLSLLDNRTEEEFVEMNKRLINVMASVVNDDLLKHTYATAHWRLVRWRVLDIRQDNALNWHMLEVGLKEGIKMAMKRDAAALMDFAAMMGQRHIHTTPDEGFAGADVHRLDLGKS